MDKARRIQNQSTLFGELLYLKDSGDTKRLEEVITTFLDKELLLTQSIIEDIAFLEQTFGYTKSFFSYFDEEKSRIKNLMKDISKTKSYFQEYKKHILLNLEKDLTKKQSQQKAFININLFFNKYEPTSNLFLKNQKHETIHELINNNMQEYLKIELSKVPNSDRIPVSDSENNVYVLCDKRDLYFKNIDDLIKTYQTIALLMDSNIKRNKEIKKSGNEYR